MTRSDVPFRDLTGAYALDSLDGTDLAGFLAYLETDEEARAEATQLLDTAALLGAAVLAVPPPPGLRARVLAFAEVLPARPARPVAAPRPVATLRARARRRWIPVLAAAAAVAAIAAGGVAGIAALPDPASGVDRIRAASDVRTVRAAAQDGGSAEVVWSPSERRAAVTLVGMPALSGGRVYELWFIDRVGLATRAGLIHSDELGSPMLLDGRLGRGDTIGVTVEPKGGSDAPTTTPVVEVATA